MNLRNMKSPLPAIALALFFTSCAGYQLGNVPYEELKGIKKIYVPVVHNETFEPGIQVMVTNAMIRKFDQDGTYKTGRARESDATLEVKIVDLERRTLQRARQNELLSEQYNITLTAEVTFLNHLTGQKFMDKAEFIGRTDYYLSPNRMQEGERQSLVLAAQDLADNIVREITEGW
jgi:hypothetical protein